jgi:uncharacterized flavoprotein (TIGR03862 family)
VRHASSSRVAVIGAGPAGMMAAEVVAHAGATVTLYDRMPSAGRKFLLAGRGGLNLTHSEELERLLGRYGAAGPRLRPAIEAFPPAELRAWCEALGQTTFVGSSGRVFPRAFKASPLLRAWLRRLTSVGVMFKPRHHWRGWDGEGRLLFTVDDRSITVESDATVLALGGASWPRLGSDGGWVDILSRAGIAVAPLRPANCGFITDWSKLFRTRFEGQPLKRIALSFDRHTVRGEAIVTRSGLEGGGVYALAAHLRDAIAAAGEATLRLDLLPDITAAQLQQRLAAPRNRQSLSTFLRKAAKLSPVTIALLQETHVAASGPLSAMTPSVLAHHIKAVPVRLTAAAPIGKAISTAGGIIFDEVGAQFMLRRRPGTFVAGEMLDWEAPTGGYLMQASFSTGAAAGRGALQWLQRPRKD